jgi:hypothetical protein
MLTAVSFTAVVGGVVGAQVNSALTLSKNADPTVAAGEVGTEIGGGQALKKALKKSPVISALAGPVLKNND